MHDKKNVITHLQIIHTWAEFARERDLQFFTPKHLEDIAQWSDDALALLKEQEEAHKILVEKADEMYAMLKEQGWHLLTEDDNGITHGLPGDDGRYLMTDGKEIWIDNYVDSKDGLVWIVSGHAFREVTAWMYMPELPKQKGR